MNIEYFFNIFREHEGEELSNKETWTPETAYYMKQLVKYEQKGRPFVSWNWSAFLFPTYWLAYRKMYSYFFIFLLIDSFLFLFVESVTDVGFKLALRLLHLLLGFFVVGMFGNYIYLKRIQKRRVGKGTISMVASILWGLLLGPVLTVLTLFLVQGASRLLLSAFS